MKYCPLCDKRYGDEAELCELDGAILKISGDKKDPYLDKVIRGRYHVLSKIGEGGMGTVYLAEQTSVGRKVALKLLQGSYASDEEFVGRFRREARLAASLNHRNIVTVYDFDQADDGSLFIAMEFLKGHRLSDVIRRDAPLDIGRAAYLGLQITEGLEAAHGAGVIHRDIKPDNIMVVGEGSAEEIKLMDFGIARLRDAGTTLQITRAGYIMGTPAYMAPEQAEGAEVSERTDIYALGIVLYEMFGGTVPFKAATPSAVIIKQIQEPPVPLRKVRPDVPVAVERVIMQALGKKPAQRQRDMHEVQEQLRSVQEQLKSAAGSKSWPPRPWNFSRAFKKQVEAKPAIVASPAVEGRTVLLNDQPAADPQDTPRTIASTQVLSRDETYPGGSRKPIVKWVVALLAVFGLAAVLGTVIYMTTREPDGSRIVPPPPPAIVSLMIESNKNNLAPMERTFLNASAKYSDGKMQAISSGLEWRSSNNAVVTVNAKGEVEGRKEGVAEITVQHDGQVSSPVTLVVKAERPAPPPAPALVSLTVLAPKHELKANERIALVVNGRYSDGRETKINKGVTWSSSDDRIASVDSSGRVTARNSGNVQIDASYEGKNREIKLTVKDKPVPAPQPPVEPDLRLANALYQDGKYQEAIAECDKILRTYPQHGKTSELRRKVLNACKKEGLCR